MKPISLKYMVKVVHTVDIAWFASYMTGATIRIESKAVTARGAFDHHRLFARLSAKEGIML
jgi:hypothetical protein